MPFDFYRNDIHPMKLRTRIFTPPLLACLIVLMVLTGGHVAQAQTTDNQTQTQASKNHDPFERANRAVLKFNFQADRFVLKPAAKVYARLPRPVRSGVGNFFANLFQPTTIVNELLQGKFAAAGKDTGRFAINTTLGLFGLFDVASAFNLPKHNEDFGQTLAVWGVPTGPYLVLPLLGPSNLRDTVGSIPQYATDPVSALDSPERWYASGLRVTNARAGLLGIDDALELQTDRYLFLREEYRQRRNRLVHDGTPPGADSDAQLQDELLEQEGEN